MHKKTNTDNTNIKCRNRRQALKSKMLNQRQIRGAIKILGGPEPPRISLLRMGVLRRQPKVHLRGSAEKQAALLVLIGSKAEIQVTEIDIGFQQTDIMELKVAAAMEAILEMALEGFKKEINREVNGRTLGTADVEVRRTCADSLVCGECIIKKCPSQQNTPVMQRNINPGWSHSSYIPMLCSQEPSSSVMRSRLGEIVRSRFGDSNTSARSTVVTLGSAWIQLSSSRISTSRCATSPKGTPSAQSLGLDKPEFERLFES